MMIDMLRLNALRGALFGGFAHHAALKYALCLLNRSPFSARADFLSVDNGSIKAQVLI